MPKKLLRIAALPKNERLPMHSFSCCGLFDYKSTNHNWGISRTQVSLCGYEAYDSATVLTSNNFEQLMGIAYNRNLIPVDEAANLGANILLAVHSGKAPTARTLILRGVIFPAYSSAHYIELPPNFVLENCSVRGGAVGFYNGKLKIEKVGAIAIIIKTKIQINQQDQSNSVAPIYENLGYAITAVGAIADADKKSPLSEVSQLSVRSLGEIVRSGNLDDAKKAELLGQLELMAEPVNTPLSHEASYQLGMIWLEGKTVGKNIVKALQRLARAGEHVGALYQHGLMCWEGQDVPQDREAAINLWERAAQKGHVEASYKAGKAYLEGQVVEKNIKKALSILEPVAKGGHQDAMYQYAVHAYQEFKNARRETTGLNFLADLVEQIGLEKVISQLKNDGHLSGELLYRLGRELTSLKVYSDLTNSGSEQHSQTHYSTIITHFANAKTAAKTRIEQIAACWKYASNLKDKNASYYLTKVYDGSLTLIIRTMSVDGATLYGNVISTKDCGGYGTFTQEQRDAEIIHTLTLAHQQGHLKAAPDLYELYQGKGDSSSAKKWGLEWKKISDRSNLHQTSSSGKVKQE